MRGTSERKNAHAPNSDVGGSQDGGGGYPPPSSPPPPLTPPPPTPPRSPSPPPSTPPRFPSPPPSTPPRSPSPPPSTQRSPVSVPVSVLPSASTSHESTSDEISNVDDCAGCTEQKTDNKEMIISLIAEIDEENHVLIQKIKMLSERYKYFRPIERDGSCFYRAFIFSYLEHVFDIKDDSERISEVNHFRKCIEKAKQAYGNLVSWGYQRSLPDVDAFEYVFNLIEAGLSSEQLYWADMKDSIISSTVPCLRWLTEIELCSQEEFYNPFLSSVEEYESVHEFCQYEVQPKDAEANHWQIVALVNALGIPLVLENLDTSLSYGMVQINQHTFCPRSDTEIIQVFANSCEEPEERTFADLSPAERRRTVTLLYRPGHYDILYLK